MQTLLLSYLSNHSTELIRYGGLAFILLMVFIETGLLIGVFIPGGGSLLLTAGLLAGSELLPTPIYLLIPAVIFAATLGDLLGYGMGRWLGPGLQARGDTWYYKQHMLLKARRFYERHGLSAIIIGRFLPFIRTFNPLLAGLSQISIHHYLGLCLSGTIIWVTAIMGSSYLIGQQFPALKKHLGFVIIAVLVVSILPGLVRYLSMRYHKSQA